MKRIATIFFTAISDVGICSYGYAQEQNNTRNSVLIGRDANGAKITINKETCSPGRAKGFGRELDVSRDSGWRGGGYDPTRWCNDMISTLRGDYPQGVFNVVSKSEDTKNTCSPFNCPQYIYKCTVHIKADPICDD